MLLWAHLHGNEPFNLVSSHDGDGDEGGRGGSDSDSDEATPDVLMLKVNLDVELTQGPHGRPRSAGQAADWPRLAKAGRSLGQPEA